MVEQKHFDNINAQIEYCRRNHINPVNRWPSTWLFNQLARLFDTEKAVVGVTYEANLMLDGKWVQGTVTFHRNEERPTVKLNHETETA